MNRRAGATLVEVLIAIFVMGIGLMSLLALFPLGAFRMQQALQDSRASQVGNIAAALATARGVRQDNDVKVIFDTPANAGKPVYVDPIGRYGLSPIKVANTIPRSPVSYAVTQGEAIKWFTLLDDINFERDGTPSLPVQRQGAFSWCYLVRRPDPGNPAVVDLTVVVYHKRPLSFSTSLQPDEEKYDAVFDTTRNVVKLTRGTSQVVPKLRPGNWILDASTTKDPVTNKDVFHGSFHRVARVTTLSATTYDVEVEQPFRDFPTGATIVNPVVIVLEGVVEVIEKGTGRSIGQ